jgi:hypothetical protein
LLANAISRISPLQWVGDVPANGDGNLACGINLPAHLLCRLAIDVGDANSRTGQRHAFGDSSTVASASTGHNRNLAFEQTGQSAGRKLNIQ